MKKERKGNCTRRPAKAFGDLFIEVGFSAPKTERNADTKPKKQHIATNRAPRRRKDTCDLTSAFQLEKAWANVERCGKRLGDTTDKTTGEIKPLYAYCGNRILCPTCCSHYAAKQRRKAEALYTSGKLEKNISRARKQIASTIEEIKTTFSDIVSWVESPQQGQVEQNRRTWLKRLSKLKESYKNIEKEGLNTCRLKKDQKNVITLLKSGIARASQEQRDAIIEALKEIEATTDQIAEYTWQVMVWTIPNTLNPDQDIKTLAEGNKKIRNLLWADKCSGLLTMIDYNEKGTMHIHAVGFLPQIDEEELQEAWHRYTGGRVTHIEPLKEGIKGIAKWVNYSLSSFHKRTESGKIREIDGQTRGKIHIASRRKRIALWTGSMRK